jgi:hypothetical protein
MKNIISYKAWGAGLMAITLTAACDQIKGVADRFDKPEAEVTTIEVPTSTVLYDGGDISVFEAGETTILTQVPSGLVISSFQKNASSGYTTQGAFLTLNTDWEQDAIGKMVEVKVTARKAGDNPSGSFGIAYSTAATGNSGWKITALDTEPREYTLLWKIPATAQQPGEDYIGIWADPKGIGRTIIVEKVQVQLFDVTE